MKYAQATNAAAEAAVNADIARGEISPVALGRFFVRGFLASNSLSAILLNPMAADLAAVKAATHSSISRSPNAAPQMSARHSAESAKGRANRVCSTFTSLA